MDGIFHQNGCFLEVRAVGLKIFLSSTLRKYYPAYDPSAGIEMNLEADTPLAALLDRLGIPQEHIKIVMVDGLHASLDAVLKGDERVALFPPVGGG